MTAAPASTIEGSTLIGRHPVLSNLPLIAVLSGIAAAVFGTLTGAVLGGLLDIGFGPAVAIPLWFIAIAGACLTYLGIAYGRVGVDTRRGTVDIGGETLPLQSVTSGTLLTRTPAATVPVLSLRLTTETGRTARVVVNGGWLRSIRTADFIPLTALIAGSGIPDETGEDPIASGKERMSRALAGKSTDLAITRRGFIVDCIAAAEQSGDPELLAAVVAAAGPIGRSITDEAARTGRERERAQAGAPSGAAATPPTPQEYPGVEPILPPAPQFGTVGGAVDERPSEVPEGDDDRFRRPDDPARVGAPPAGTADGVHLDKLDARGGASPGQVDVAPPTERELPSWVQPQDRARMLAWLDDDDDVVHLQPLPETVGARTLRRACDWILAGVLVLGFIAIILAAVAEQAMDGLPSDLNDLVAIAVVGAALLAFAVWLVGGIARASEIGIAQRVSLEWLDRRDPDQRRRGLPPVLLQHFLGPVPASRMFTAGAYAFSVVGGIGLLAGILLTVDPEDLGPATGPIILLVGVALTVAGIALFIVRAHRTKRQRELAVELGGERLAFLGNL